MQLRTGVQFLMTRWITIVSITMVFLLTALIYLVVTPRTYRAQAKAFVSVNSTSQSNDPAGSINAGGPVRAESDEVVLRSSATAIWCCSR